MGKFIECCGEYLHRRDRLGRLYCHQCNSLWVPAPLTRKDEEMREARFGSLAEAQEHMDWLESCGIKSGVYTSGDDWVVEYTVPGDPAPVDRPFSDVWLLWLAAVLIAGVLGFAVWVMFL